MRRGAGDELDRAAVGGVAERGQEVAVPAIFVVGVGLAQELLVEARELAER